MTVELTPGGSSLIDVLDRILDKGIVVDARTRISPSGIDLVGSGARLITVSIDCHLKYAEGASVPPTVARKDLGQGEVNVSGSSGASAGTARRS